VGRDLYMVVQVKEGEEWRLLPPLPSLRHVEFLAPDEEELKENLAFRWSLVRNYALHDVLSLGFETGSSEQDVWPIASPRGLPEGHGFSDRFIDYFLGDLGHSWVTLREAMEYPDWGREVAYWGKEVKPLREWCKDFHDEILVHLRQYADARGISYGAVRLVFGYDG